MNKIRPLLITAIVLSFTTLLGCSGSSSTTQENLSSPGECTTAAQNTRSWVDSGVANLNKACSTTSDCTVVSITPTLDSCQVYCTQYAINVAAQTDFNNLLMNAAQTNSCKYSNSYCRGAIPMCAGQTAVCTAGKCVLN